jgi:hypothetical protein
MWAILAWSIKALGIRASRADTRCIQQRLSTARGDVEQLQRELIGRWPAKA